jgi:hypothetical protein
MAFIDQKELFEKTDGGRIVIEHYYPSSTDAFRDPHRKFKCRTSEKTASASVKRMEDGNWIVTDFGGDGQPRNAIQIVMLEEGVEFKQAIDIIAAMFGIVPDEQRAQVIKPEIRKAKAEPDTPEGYTFVEREFTWRDLQTLLAPKVLEYLTYMAKDDEAAKQEESILKEVTRVFAAYKFHALESYTIVKDGQATTISGTELYPMYFFQEKDWKKIYQPKSVNPSFRFMHWPKNVAHPKDFVFGYEAAKKAYDEVSRIDDGEVDDDEEMASKKKPKKLKNVFICSGGSDGLNLAVIGQAFKKTKNVDVIAECYYPVWLNSETAKLSIGNHKNLAAISENLYNIPDIDPTGKKAAHALATEYLDVRTVYLPEDLKNQSDTYRKKPLKDLRDYFKHYKVWDFFNLVKTAYPYRFWDMKPEFNKQGEFVKWGYSVNNKHLYNFLARNGFFRYETEAEKDGYIYIQIDGNIVRKIEPKRIRDFINGFIEARNPDVELMNTFLRTNQLNENSLSNLPFVKIDFTDFDRNSQWFFYANGVAEVTAQQINTYKPGELHKYVWEDEVVNHKVKPIAPMFTIAPVCNLHTREETLHIQLHNTECLVLRYLINASRICWREELENRLTGIVGERERAEYATLHRFTETDMCLLNGLPAKERETYRTEHKFTIDGPLLTEREKCEQHMQLINKIFAIGYVFHRYKEASKAWAIWSMDAKLSDGEDSHGGSGKSLLPMVIYENKLMKTQYREGRNPKLIDNPHIYEGIDRHTDLLIIDDCFRFLKFDFFFSAITGPITVNPKNAKQYTVPFTHSPKLWFSSNYPPFNIDPSMERRIIYTIFSDYYHYNKMGEYNEERRVFDDFGKNLGTDFTENEWNLFLNFLMQCTQFYLSTSGQRINPPMDNVNKRNLKSAMGEAFEPWADVYFSQESGRLDTYVIKEDALTDYVKATNQKNLTSQRFKKQLMAWCHYNNVEYNPKDLCTGTGLNIIQRVKYRDKDGNEKEGAKEMLYLKTKPTAEQKIIETYNSNISTNLSNQETLPF